MNKSTNDYFRMLDEMYATRTMDTPNFTNEELQMLKLLDANIQFCGLDGEDTVGIPNEKGLVLPETGGNGAFIYIATGLILLCIAAYGLYKKFLFRKEATF